MKPMIKPISLLLSLCLLLSLVGCGGTNRNAVTPDGSSPANDSPPPVVALPESSQDNTGDQDADKGTQPPVLSEDESGENMTPQDTAQTPAEIQPSVPTEPTPSGSAEAAPSTPPEGTAGTNSVPKPEETPNTEEAESTHMLIAYFSWADNAEEFDLDSINADVLGHASVVAPGDVGVIAQYIEDRTQADVFKIVVTEPYSANYDEALNQGRTQRDQGARPALASTVENMENYDVIFLGFPNWWYTIPVAVHSFVEAHDLSGKTIIPFVTHGTGGLSGTIRDLTAALPDTCTILQSYDVFEDDVFDAQEAVNNWLADLGY